MDTPQIQVHKLHNLIQKALIISKTQTGHMLSILPKAQSLLHIDGNFLSIMASVNPEEPELCVLSLVDHFYAPCMDQFAANKSLKSSFSAIFGCLLSR